MTRFTNTTAVKTLSFLHDTILLEKYLTSYQPCKTHNFKKFP